MCDLKLKIQVPQAAARDELTSVLLTVSQGHELWVRADPRNSWEPVIGTEHNLEFTPRTQIQTIGILWLSPRDSLYRETKINLRLATEGNELITRSSTIYRDNAVNYSPDSEVRIGSDSDGWFTREFAGANFRWRVTAGPGDVGRTKQLFAPHHPEPPVPKQDDWWWWFSKRLLIGIAFLVLLMAGWCRFQWLRPQSDDSDFRNPTTTPTPEGRTSPCPSEQPVPSSPTPEADDIESAIRQIKQKIFEELERIHRLDIENFINKPVRTTMRIIIQIEEITRQVFNAQPPGIRRLFDGANPASSQSIQTQNWDPIYAFESGEHRFRQRSLAVELGIEALARFIARTISPQAVKVEVLSIGYADRDVFSGRRTFGGAPIEFVPDGLSCPEILGRGAHAMYPQPIFVTARNPLRFQWVPHGVSQRARQQAGTLAAVSIGGEVNNNCELSYARGFEALMYLWELIEQHGPNAEFDFHEDVGTGDALAQLGPHEPARLEAGLLFDGLGLDRLAHRHLADLFVGDEEDFIERHGRGQQNGPGAVVLDDALGAQVVSGLRIEIPAAHVVEPTPARDDGLHRQFHVLDDRDPFDLRLTIAD